MEVFYKFFYCFLFYTNIAHFTLWSFVTKVDAKYFMSAFSFLEINNLILNENSISNITKVKSADDPLFISETYLTIFHHGMKAFNCDLTLLLLSFSFGFCQILLKQKCNCVSFLSRVIDATF